LYGCFAESIAAGHRKTTKKFTQSKTNFRSSRWVRMVRPTLRPLARSIKRSMWKLRYAIRWTRSARKNILNFSPNSWRKTLRQQPTYRWLRKWKSLASYRSMRLTSLLLANANSWLTLTVQVKRPRSHCPVTPLIRSNKARVTQIASFGWGVSLREWQRVNTLSAASWLDGLANAPYYSILRLIVPYGFAGSGFGGSGFGILNVHVKPKSMVRPCGRARAWYSS